MEYAVEFRPKAIKDLDSLSPEIARRVVEKADRLRHDLEGDVKRLTNFTPEYRLRVGDYRVLFEVEGSRVIVYRVRHRREVYR
ncbi:MAG: type II toxin-antitoxin system RelE/ParE family toxin [Verrucomicrobia bacterium]|nr:type II toxin-antitoxin system RelE/ParE family toxin [Verrucomicrobiota bacterium]